MAQEQLTRPQQGVNRVAFRNVVSNPDLLKLKLLVAANAFLGAAFLIWLVLPSHLPLSGTAPWSGQRGLAVLTYILVVGLELIRILQNATLWVFASRMRDPIPSPPVSGLRVAILTTIVPSKEPLDVLSRTLQAMKAVEYDGLVDVWVLDEGDDPGVKWLARRLGVRHFSRKARPEYNQLAGEFRTKTKAGNHNAWRAEHEGDYDIVAQMDPDHIPHADFLHRTIGYFRDPDVAFVVAPQVYGNAEASFVARAAAEQAYLFHGVIQRGGNGLGAPLLIGTNHLYRANAWRQIGGYQDSIIEDHLTSMYVHAAMNPDTGRKWKGVYTPEIIALGDGPSTWTDYFNQQKRWAYGVWDVVLHHSAQLFPRLTIGQRFSYAGLQFYYPSVGLIWFLGSALTSLYMLFGVTTIMLDTLRWALLWGATILAQFFLTLWLRRFNLQESERRTWGLRALFLSVVTSPIYAAAGLTALARRTLNYVVTGKGNLAGQDTLGTFKAHTGWLSAAIVAIGVSVAAGHDYWLLRLWAGLAAVAATTPLLHLYLTNRRRRQQLVRRRGRSLSKEYFRPLIEEPATPRTAASPRSW